MLLGVVAGNFSVSEESFHFDTNRIRTALEFFRGLF